MALDTQFSWLNWKENTKIKGSRRGKNMQQVNGALKAYWDAVQRKSVTDQLASLVVLVEACSTWLKYKKDKMLKPTQKEHFKSRWNNVTRLGTAAHMEAMDLLTAGAQMADSAGRARLKYAKRKLVKQHGLASPNLQPLQQPYSGERAEYLGGEKKASSPTSATSMDDFLKTMTRKRFQDRSGTTMAELDQKYGDHPLTRKQFEHLTPDDYATLRKIFEKCLEKVYGTRYVEFLDKRHRMKYMLTPNAQGLLTYGDGTLANTGGRTGDAYAMDRYGNLSIGDPTIVKKEFRFNHSSLVAGDDVLCADMVKIKAGKLLLITNASGHYKPTGQNLYEALLELDEQGVDLSQTLCDIIQQGTNAGFTDVPWRDVIQHKGNLPANYGKSSSSSTSTTTATTAGTGT